MFLNTPLVRLATHTITCIVKKKMKKKVLLKSYFVTLKLNSILVNQSFVIGQYFQGYLFSFSLVITNKVAMNCKFPKK